MIGWSDITNIGFLIDKRKFAKYIINLIMFVYNFALMNRSAHFMIFYNLHLEKDYVDTRIYLL